MLEHPEFAARLGREGRTTAERYYDWRALGARMCDVYEDVYQGKRPADPPPLPQSEVKGALLTGGV